MNLFGKLKNSGPPTLPRRDGNAQTEIQQGDIEEEDEYSDMYEVPPCERLMNVPQRQTEENVYLERSCSSSLSQRPPPRPNFTKSSTGDISLNSQNVKPPAVNRTDKPGRKKMAVPIKPSPQPEEDVYLDPCEEQDSSEDLYLEPAEACALLPGEAKTMPPYFKPALPSPEPMLKPPLPQDKLSSPTGTEVEARRFSLPKSPPPVAVKPWSPTNQKEKSGRPDPPVLVNKPGASFGGGVVQKSAIENREWFAEDCNRKMAEDLLQSVKKDGAFLVRNSSTQNSHQPYTLAVLYQHKVYNIPVRFLDEAQGYALGKEGKKNEEVFSTLDDMISYHKNNKLLLIDSKSQAKNTTYLTCAIHP